ncbi:hypothetical protein [Tolypothrix sp. VBCCA 56010]|uniref:hypothetical protein n=1 Tax=Tolypothrix sp. VBCCA 56010 TaxID=3137731 RepID=UPI003D7D30DB
MKAWGILPKDRFFTDCSYSTVTARSLNNVSRLGLSPSPTTAGLWDKGAAISPRFWCLTANETL